MGEMGQRKKKKSQKADLIYLLNHLNLDLSNDTFVLLGYFMNECQIELSQKKFASHVCSSLIVHFSNKP